MDSNENNVVSYSIKKNVDSEKGFRGWGSVPIIHIELQTV